jgi:steroid delta-isomerase-like uncharacterized protein
MTAIAPTTPGLELVQRYLDAFNRADWDAFKACLAPDSVHIEPGGVEARGPDAIVEAVKVFRTAMPDLTGTVVRHVMGPDAAMSELVWRGTHTGPLPTPTGTIDPTGRDVTVHACKVFAFEGDRITYGRHYWDLTELLGAIGALPAPG